MSANNSFHPDVDIDFLHEISSRMAAADPLHEVLAQIVEFASALVKCDSCFVYVVEGDELVLRASKNPHEEVVDRLKLKMGQGITGWVAEHREPVAVPNNAYQDVRFKLFNELPEDRYEACQCRFSLVRAPWASSMCSIANHTRTRGGRFALFPPSAFWSAPRLKSPDWKARTPNFYSNSRRANCWNAQRESCSVI